MQTNEKHNRFPVLVLSWNVLEELIKTIGSQRAESGGIIGGKGDSTAVTHCYFDKTSSNSAVTYSPDHNFVNQHLKFEWNPQDIRLKGFPHSHPGFNSSPSHGDTVYAERILNGIEDLLCLWVPIINTIPDTGIFKLTPWVVFPSKKGVSVEKGQVQIINVPQVSSLEICGIKVIEIEALKLGLPLDEIVIGKKTHKRPTLAIPDENFPITLAKSIVGNSGELKNVIDKIRPQNSDMNRNVATFDIRNTFDRVQSAYNLDLMHKTRIIAVGVGGAAEYLETLARAGVGQFVMIDPDVVSETNLATQQVYRKDIGRPKVDCIAERIRDINPTAVTIALQKNLDDLNDDEMKAFAVDPIDGFEPGKTIICGLTDNFFAQARVNRLALHLGIPSLCAQVYKEGRGAEVTFTYPGVTPACHRCILSSRYSHYLEKGQENNVTSHGTPIFATARLNAIKGFLTLALSHHGTNHPRWGSMLLHIGKRNLVQLRLDPDFAEIFDLTVFDKVFKDADRDRLFFDEAVWLPQNQECPDSGNPICCPDCGGTGNLSDSIGKFDDTRLQLKEQATSPSHIFPFKADTLRAVAAYKLNGGSCE
jgi:hypothetical protein